MTVDALEAYLKANWEAVKVALLNDDDYPSAIRKVIIPKPSGGERQLGIPTVMDRLIQGLHQVLSPIYDPTFSDNSYGFHPGRSAHQALLQAQAYINEDKRWVVDVDLSKPFDEVNHPRFGKNNLMYLRSCPACTGKEDYLFSYYLGRRENPRG